jgi:hypothetical protein
MKRKKQIDLIRENFRTCVWEMYHMEKGAFIFDPDKEIARFGGCHITRRQVKHIIEQRKDEGKSAEEIVELLCLIPQATVNYNFEIPNRNLKYPGSVLRALVFPGKTSGIIVVLDKPMDGVRDVITALQKKKLDTSAAGETPNP